MFEVRVSSSRHAMGEHVFSWKTVESALLRLCDAPESGWIACQRCAGCDSSPFVWNYDGLRDWRLWAEVEPDAAARDIARGRIAPVAVACKSADCPVRLRESAGAVAMGAWL